METKRIIVEGSEVKMLSDGPANGRIEMYASTYGNEDRVGDIFLPGAFTDSLPKFLNEGMFLVGHDWGDLPAGYPVSAVDDDHGVKVAADFHSTSDAQDARTITVERLGAGKMVGVSVGFKTIDSTPRFEDNEWGPRIISKAELYEVSLVNVPCNPMAQVFSAKGLHTGLQMTDHSEAVLTAVREFEARLKSHAALYTKAGRVLSQANRDRIETHIAALDSCTADLRDLLVATEPKAAVDVALKAMAEWAITEARLSGAISTGAIQ